MATDGPTPQDCHGEAYEGPEVFQTHSIGGSNAVERWVRKIAATSGQLVDWHFAGGCVIDRVRALLGHRDVQTTERYLGRYRSDETEVAVDVGVADVLSREPAKVVPMRGKRR